MKYIFSGVLYVSTTAAVWTYFPTFARERSPKLCYTSWCAQCPLTWLRELLVKTIWQHMKKDKWKWFFFFSSSLLCPCLEINFGSHLQKLSYQKHTYFRFHLCRAGKLLSVHFHSGEFCNFPDTKSLNVLITSEPDPFHLLGKKLTLFFLRHFHLAHVYEPLISAAHKCIVVRLHYY